jgi:hypothetical protein
MISVASGSGEGYQIGHFESRMEKYWPHENAARFVGILVMTFENQGGRSRAGPSRTMTPTESGARETVRANAGELPWL